MCSRFNRIFAPLLFSFFMAACASTPVSHDPDPEHLAVTKRFLHSWDAGDIAMSVFHRNLEQTYKDQPGVAELVERAFSDFTAEDFENLAARVCVRHLDQEELAELARFTESPTGNRFFRMSVAGALEGNTVNDEDITRQFNADELGEIVQFSQSDAFVVLKQALPTINRELGEEGRQLGETRMREYLEPAGQASVGQSG